MRALLRALLDDEQLERFHLCRQNKVRYRKHLTVGVLVSFTASVAGGVFDVALLTHVAGVANFITAIWWIWE